MLTAMDTIDSFRGEYRFLSNFYLASFVDKGGNRWATSEHYYQAQKVWMTGDAMGKIKVMNAKSPGDAKRLGEGIKPDNWYDLSLDVMREALRYKFDQNEDIKQKLLDTGDAILIEGNTWGDDFWGQVKGKGLNMLGKLLMELRNEYRRREGSG